MIIDAWAVGMPIMTIPDPPLAEFKLAPLPPPPPPPPVFASAEVATPGVVPSPPFPPPPGPPCPGPIPETSAVEPPPPPPP